jgi:hypothetical protein
MRHHGRVAQLAHDALRAAAARQLRADLHARRFAALRSKIASGGVVRRRAEREREGVGGLG